MHVQLRSRTDQMETLAKNGRVGAAPSRARTPRGPGEPRATSLCQPHTPSAARGREANWR
eukprot:586878-Prymnesium_polylepis.1